MKRALLALLLAAAPAAAWTATAAPPGAAVYFIAPADGAVLRGPVTVKFGLKGMGVAPAGVQHPATGHHHLLIDTSAPPPGLPVPTDERHRHFGGGQTEAVIELPPGRHTLQLLLGDYAHVPHDPPILSAPITVTVE